MLTLQAVEGVASMLSMDVRSGTVARFSIRKLFISTLPVFGLEVETSFSGLGVYSMLPPYDTTLSRAACID